MYCCTGDQCSRPIYGVCVTDSEYREYMRDNGRDENTGESLSTRLLRQTRRGKLPQGEQQQKQQSRGKFLGDLENMGEK